MSTFLQLCQKLARESGSVSGGATQPASVLAQVGRLAKVVGWTSDAWVEIQNLRKDWLFLQKKFTSALIINTSEYMPASFGLTDVNSWNSGFKDYSIYDPALGGGDLSWLRPVEYDSLYANFLVGGQTANRPRFYATGPDGALCVGPMPDKSYVFNGRYRRSAQVMAANTDVPICHADYHDTIVWRAMKKLHGSDEAPTAFNFDDETYKDHWSNFLRANLPKVGNVAGTGGSPLA